MAQNAPTKGNLIAAKRSRALAQNGYELMDKKRNILIRELMTMIDEASKLKERIDSTFTEAYASLRLANISVGGCEDLARATPIDHSVRVRYRSVMGVELPSVSGNATDADVLPYGFTDTSSAVDEAYKKFSDVKALILELAEIENSIYRLAYSIKKAQKRANALNNIVIPGLEADITRISELLEEKDREEFVRLKVIKLNSQKK